jgi:hypothetical protein
MTGNFNEAHGFGFAGFEPHGSTGGNVEPAPCRNRAIEVERAIRLGEVVVAADLDWSVAAIGHLHLHRYPALVQRDVAVGRNDFPGRP